MKVLECVILVKANSIEKVTQQHIISVEIVMRFTSDPTMSILVDLRRASKFHYNFPYNSICLE